MPTGSGEVVEFAGVVQEGRNCSCNPDKFDLYFDIADFSWLVGNPAERQTLIKGLTYNK
jgi:hypothetical protein